MAVAAPLGVLAALAEAGQHLGQDRDRAREARAVGRDQRVRVRARDRVRERVEVERAHQARVQALEVEHGDVPEHAGLRLHDRAARNAAGRLALAVHRRRDPAAPAQLGQVEQVERGDARADPVELHARTGGSARSRARAATPSRGSPARARRPRGCRRRTRAGPRGTCARSRRRGRGRTSRSACRGRAGSARAVSSEKSSSWMNASRARPMPSSTIRPGISARRWRVNDASWAIATGPGARPSSSGIAERARARDQDVEVEVDDVPAGEDVGVELAHARDERAHERRLVGVHERAVDRRGGEDVHLVGAGADERHREDAARVRQGLEVEREDAQLGARAAGHELGVAEAEQRRIRRAPARPRSRRPRAGPCRRGSGTGSAGRPRAPSRRPRSACRAGAAPRAAPARRRARAARRRDRRARSARSRRRARRRAAASPRDA